MKRMEKKNRRILIWSVLGALLLLFFFAPRPPKIGVNDNSGSLDATKPVILTSTSSSSGSNPPYITDIEYPHLAGLKDQGIMDKVNEDIKSGVDATVRDFKSNLNPPIPDLKDGKNTLTVRYTTPYLTKYILSVGLESSSYTIGSAHESSFVDTYTYDLRTGRKIALADLFKTGSDYLKIISNYSISDLERQLRTDPKDNQATSQIMLGAGPKADNFRNFLITKEGLTIIFDRYQVAPGAAGALRVAVPYALLEKDVDPAGLLAVRFVE